MVHVRAAWHALEGRPTWQRVVVPDAIHRERRIAARKPRHSGGVAEAIRFQSIRFASPRETKSGETKAEQCKRTRFRNCDSRRYDSRHSL